MKTTARIAALALLSTSTLTLAQPAQARTARPMLGYFLPKAAISAAVSQRLVACPAEGNGDIEVVTQWELASKAVADPGYFHEIDAHAGFLAKRNVELTLNENGTLAGINAAAEGQGGAVVSSVLKLAATFAPMLAGVEVPVHAPMGGGRGGKISRGDSQHKSGRRPAAQPIQRCNEKTLAALAEQARLTAEIGKLEETVAADGITDTEKAMLDARKDKLALVEARLTLEGDVDAAKLNNDLDQRLMGARVRIAPLDYSQWFVNNTTTTKARDAIPGGRHGFLLGWTANQALAKVLKDGGEPSVDEHLELVYRRPVPAKLTGVPCLDNADTCTVDESPAGAAASAVMPFAAPQLSGLFRLPVGSAGIFGSREVKASFDALGRPTTLSYGSDPGSEKIAGAIDSLGEAASGIRDARLNAIKHETELLTAIKDLQDAKLAAKPAS